MVLLLLLLATQGVPFLLDSPGKDQCIAPSPCVCDGASIRCENLGLTTIPAFKESDVEYKRLIVRLNDNNITDVGNGSFINLDTTNASDIEIDLSRNQISSISDSAFSPVASEITILSLRHNNLTKIPSELGNLLNLDSLDLRGNALSTLSDPVTFSLSRSLKSLSISLNLFSKWPQELRYFRLLSKLSIDGFQFPQFPLNALTGEETTLTSLDISNSKLDRIPSVVCHLRNLKRLSYNSNPDTKSPIFEPCYRNITSLNFLSINDNNLTRFPDIFQTFVTLDYLDISDNNIRTIDTNLIPEDNMLTHLNLSYNLLNRIPTAISRFTFLKALYIAGNRITSLEDFDLMNLTRLNVLQLQNNPLEYISYKAFRNIRWLNVLNLANTNINVIPQAVTSLSGIHFFDVEGAPIQCTCQMSFLKSWASNTSLIHGTCEGTRESLSSFITSFLPLCP